MKITYEEEIIKLQNELDNQQPVYKTDAFKQELAEAVQQLRSEFHQLATNHRDESDRMNQAKLNQIKQQYERETQTMGEKIRSLQAEIDRLRRSIDEAENEVLKTGVFWYPNDEG